MQNVELKNIEEATFRANPKYELMLFDRLTREQKSALKDLQKDSDFYGVLLPHGHAELGIKSVYRDTALLYFTLQTPGRLPSYVKALLEDQCNQTIAELVLDGMLEIEENGAFVSGADAYHVIYKDKALSANLGTIAQLSIEALQYAQALEINDSFKLSMRIYSYNQQPLTPALKRKFPTKETVVEYLGVQKDGSIWRMIHPYWKQIPQPPSYDEGWLLWKSRYVPKLEERSGYKIYVSPDRRYVRDVLYSTIEVLLEHPVHSFKVGCNAYGLLRPDKIVIYCESFKEVQEVADRLKSKIAGCPAHGVLFTAELTPDGLLSWGIDPPKEEHILSWQERESWRLWLTNRLATAMMIAKISSVKEMEPWQFALERIRLEGIDTQTWIPMESIWRDNS